MSKKTANNGRALLMILLILVVGVVVAWTMLRPEPEEGKGTAGPAQTAGTAAASAAAPRETTPAAQTEPAALDLGDGLVIVRSDAFSGVYMEDGSDEIVRDLLMVVLENRSTEALQYARIVLDYTDGEAVFEVTNLPAGEQVVLLEKNRMPWPGEVPLGGHVEMQAFVEAFELHEDIFRITTADGVINVKNITREDITGDIFVYYKNVGGGLYYGGITYRARIQGGLKAGEIAQVMTGHYDADASEILMVSYVP